MLQALFLAKTEHQLSLSSGLNLPYQLKNRFEFNEIGCKADTLN